MDEFFTQIHILFIWVDDEVVEQIHLPRLHVCAAQTMAIWDLYKISCDDSGIFLKLVEGKDEN